MMESSQKKAVANYRDRQAQRGIARFEVQALASDKELIRRFARALSEDGTAAQELRSAVQQRIEKPEKGGILAALRRSPLVGSDVQFPRSQEPIRPLDL